MKVKRPNVGPRERRLRIGAGVLLVVSLALPSVRRHRWLVAALALANLATVITRYCPSNALLGIDNTRGRELIHFRGNRRFGRRLNALEHRIGATWPVFG